MRTHLASRIACLVLVTATLASAQPAGPPTYAVGDTWTTTLDEFRVVKVDDNSVVMVRLKSPCPTCTFVHDRELTLLQVLESDGKPTDVSKFGLLGIGMKFYDFPLDVKKTWRIEAHGLFRGSNVPFIIDNTVSALEDVKTKAGTFKAYRVDRAWTVRVHTGPSPTWKTTSWFAPEVKWPIKFESSARNAQEWELVSYGPKR
jgi:hypothetical protein